MIGLPDIVFHCIFESQVKVLECDEYSCIFSIRIDKIIESTFVPKLGDIIVVHYSQDPIIYVQTGECVEVCGEVRTLPMIGHDLFAHPEYYGYVKKIPCPSKPEPPKPEEPRCRPGWTQSYQCYNNMVQRLYIYEDCTEEWRTVDDCNRYIQQHHCENGRCVPRGRTDTYRCYNNVVQSLYIKDDGIKEWQTIDDCNSYDPPRRCMGGICVEIDGAEPSEPVKECDSVECQGRSHEIGVPFTKDGKTYQRYKECRCVDDICKCESVEKEIPPEVKEEIKFIGTAIKFYKGEMCGAPDYWTVSIDKRIKGPQPCSNQLDVCTYQAINYVFGYEDPNIKEGDEVEVYGKYYQYSDMCSTTLCGSENYYIKKIPSQKSCGGILKYDISNGTYTKGQIILADMGYKNNMLAQADFKGVLLLRSPTGEIYSNYRKERTPSGREDKFGYNKGNAIDVRIPEDATTGWYDAKLELRNCLTDELCDETEWIENKFKIVDTQGTCINFDELSQGEITGQGLHYDQVDFTAESGRLIVDQLAHSPPNGISLYDARIAARFEVPVSRVSMWVGDWSGGTQITLYDSNLEILEEVSSRGDFKYYEFSYDEKIAALQIFSYEGAFDDFCFSSSQTNCGEIINYDISDGSYTKRQIILADMVYKSNMLTETDFKGVLLLRSPTGEIYSNYKKERTPSGREDKFGYNKGNAIGVRIPEDATTGWYDAKLELRNYLTDELCDETEWIENKFNVVDTYGTCINFDELSQGDITGQGLHYDQVDFVAGSISLGGGVMIGDLAHSPNNGIALYGGDVTALFETPVSWISVWVGDWAGGTQITLYDFNMETLEEVSPRGDFKYYEFSHDEKISMVYISSYEGAIDDFCFSSSLRPLDSEPKIEVSLISPPEGTTLQRGKTADFKFKVDYDLGPNDHGKIRVAVDKTTGGHDEEYSISLLDPHAGSQTFTITKRIGQDWNNVYVSATLYAAKKDKPLPAEYSAFDYKQYQVEGELPPKPQYEIKFEGEITEPDNMHWDGIFDCKVKVGEIIAVGEIIGKIGHVDINVGDEVLIEKYILCGKSEPGAKLEPEDWNFEKGEKVEVYGNASEGEFSYTGHTDSSFLVDLCGSNAYYFKRISPSQVGCGGILKYDVSDGTYTRGQIILADMIYKSNMPTQADFKGVLLVRSPTGKIYSNYKKERTPSGREDKFGYNKGNSIDIRIPEDASTGWYDVKLELRNYQTDELCDETGWLEDQFEIVGPCPESKRWLIGDLNENGQVSKDEMELVKCLASSGLVSIDLYDGAHKNYQTGEGKYIELNCRGPASDYSYISKSNLPRTGRRWLVGDLNDDGEVSGNEFVLIICLGATGLADIEIYEGAMDYIYSRGDSAIYIELNCDLPPQCTGMISGHVFDANTNKGIEGAELFVGETPSDSISIGIVRVESDSEGYYEVGQFCPSTSLNITCSSKGYESKTKTIITDVNGDAMNVNFSLNSEAQEHITWKTMTIYSPDKGRIEIVDGPSEDYVYATFIWNETPDTPRWFDAIDFEVRGNYEVIEPEFPNKNPSAGIYSNLPCPEGKETRIILYAVLNNLYGVGEEIAKKIGVWGIDPEPEVSYPNLGGKLYEEDKTDITIKFDPSLIEEEKEYYVKFPVKIKKSGNIILEFELKDYYHSPVENESLEIPMRKGEEIVIDINGEKQNSPSYEKPKMITLVKEIKSGTFMLGDEEIPYLSVVVENSLSPPGCQNAVGTCIPTTEEMEVVMIEKTPPPSYTARTDYHKRKSYDVDFSIERPINMIFGGEKSQEAEEAKIALLILVSPLSSIGKIFSVGQQIEYSLTQSILIDIANEEDLSWRTFLSAILPVDAIDKTGLIEIKNYYVPTGFERSYIKVYVKDQNGEPVEGAKVSTQICYLHGCEIKTEYTDAEGYCMFSAIPLSEYQPGRKYIITVEKKGYKKQDKNVKTKESVSFYLGGESIEEPAEEELV